MKPGVSPALLATDLDAVATYLRKSYPKDDDGLSFMLTRPGLVGNMLGPAVRAFVAGLMLLAGLILLAACANLGSLFAARATDRSREIALRVALGSTRGRILRQLLLRPFWSLAGGVRGHRRRRGLFARPQRLATASRIPINVPVNPDLRTYAVALVLALASGLLCGLAPVKQIFGYSSVARGQNRREGNARRPLVLRRAMCCW